MPYAFDQIFREFKIVVEKELKPGTQMAGACYPAAKRA